MGVTAIKRIFNESTSSSVVITNLENPGKAGNRVSLGSSSTPAGFANCDMWIPWCTSGEDFTHNHYIKVEVYGLATRTSPPSVIVTYRIWQAAHSDGDFVRVSTGPNYVDPGEHIRGISEVNGDRALFIKNGFVELQRL
jgi:hypothetical protein